MYKRFFNKLTGWAGVPALLAFTAAATFFAITPAQARRHSNAANRNGNGKAFGVAGNTPDFTRKAADLGPVNPDTVITVTVWLKLHNENQLDALVQQQHQRGSTQYRQWITQDQFNGSFGPTTQEVNAVQNFLNAKKLSTLFVAENNMYVKVQGTLADIQNAFHVQIHNYKFAGE